jgi:hypothetical protein
MYVLARADKVLAATYDRHPAADESGRDIPERQARPGCNKACPVVSYRVTVGKYVNT